MEFRLENFKTLYNSKEGIKSLRAYILDLAVRGKLVEQNPNDEPARVLLEKIAAEKEQLVKEKKIKKSKPLPPIEESEVYFELPKGWSFIRYGDIAQYKKGPFGSSITKSMFVSKSENTFKVYEQKNAIQKDIRLGNYYITKEKFEELKAFELNPEDIIISCAGTIGESFIVPNNIEKGIINQALMKVTLSQYIDKSYYLMHFKSILNEQVSNKSKGSAMKNIPPLEHLKSIIFPLPPLNEQKQIVERVDKLFSLCDELEKEIYNRNNILKRLPKAVVESIVKSSNREELKESLLLAIENLKTVFQTEKSIKELRNIVLQLAVEGKLVEQSIDDEPASVLLEMIYKEKETLVKDSKIKKSKPMPPIKESEIPFEIPENWEWVRLGEYFIINPRNSLDDNLEVSFIPMALIRDGFSNKHTFEKKLWKEAKSGFTHFAENDIVIAKITPCFENRKSAVMKNLINGYGAGTTELHVIRNIGDYVERDYLLSFLKTEMFIQKGIETYTGTAGQQRVKKEFISNLLLPLPPYEEQKRIIDKTNSIMRIIDSLEEEIKKKSGILNKLNSI